MPDAEVVSKIRTVNEGYRKQIRIRYTLAVGLVIAVILSLFVPIGSYDRRDFIQCTSALTILLIYDISGIDRIMTTLGLLSQSIDGNQGQ